MQVVDGLPLNAAVHIAPFTHLFRTFYIVVCHVHAARIGYLSVNDHYLAVVPSIDMVQPREADGRVFHNVDAVLAQGFQVVLLQRLVVGVIAEAVEHGTHLHAFFGFLPQQVEQQHGDGVVAEIEVFQVDAALGLTDGTEHVVELLLSGQKQGDAVVVRETDVLLPQRLYYQRVAGLRPGRAIEEIKNK